MKRFLLYSVLLLVPIAVGNAIPPGVQKVEVQVNSGGIVTPTGLENWSTVLDTTLLDNGPQTISAKATDKSGNVSGVALCNFFVRNLSTMSLSPATQSVVIGSTFTISVRMSTKIKLNAARAYLSYSPNLKAISADSTGGAFNIPAPFTISASSVDINVGSITPVTGDQLIAFVSFVPLASGPATVNFIVDPVQKNSSVLLRANNSKNVLTGTVGGTYTVQDPIDSTPPTVMIMSPTEGQQVSDTITISGMADDK